jgi:hypothetical protein
MSIEHRLFHRGYRAMTAKPPFWSALMLACHLAMPGLARDHPLLGRFQGSQQVGFREAAFDEARIITGPIDERSSREHNGAGWQTVEGKVFALYDKLPAGRTGLEALGNDQASWTGAGFEVPFSCSTEAGSCFSDERKYPGLFLGLALDGTTGLPKLQLGDFVRNFFGKLRVSVGSKQSRRNALSIRKTGAEGRLQANRGRAPAPVCQGDALAPASGFASHQGSGRPRPHHRRRVLIPADSGRLDASARLDAARRRHPAAAAAHGPLRDLVSRLAGALQAQAPGLTDRPGRGVRSRDSLSKITEQQCMEKRLEASPGIEPGCKDLQSSA